MPPTNRQQVAVATDALRIEAGEWDRQSAAIGAADPVVLARRRPSA